MPFVITSAWILIGMLLSSIFDQRKSLSNLVVELFVISACWGGTFVVRLILAISGSKPCWEESVKAMKMKTILAVAFALVGGAAFADQILVGPTVERAKEMDGQLTSLTTDREISSAPGFR